MEDKQNEGPKRRRFLDLAQARTDAVLTKLKVLGNCANRSLYAYQDEEVRQIFSEIDRELRNVKARFIKKSTKDSHFRFRG